MKHILFFALKEDILPVLEVVESKGHLKYVRTGNFTQDEIKGGVDFFNTAKELSDLGKATADSSHACETFLICERETPINLRTLQGVGDGDRVCVDQLINPDSVGFTPGGVWDKDIVLYGRVGTASESRVSQELMKRFHAAIKKAFSRVNAYYVGPKALELLKAGKRLTISAQSPREFDLSLEAGTAISGSSEQN